jgi:hypothetical protein
MPSLDASAYEALRAYRPMQHRVLECWSMPKSIINAVRRRTNIWVWSELGKSTKGTVITRLATCGRQFRKVPSITRGQEVDVVDGFRHAKVIGDLAKRELTARGHRAESEATTHERVAGLQIYDIAGFGLDRRFGETRQCCVNTDAWESVVLTIIAKTPLSHVFPSLHKIPIITSSGLLASP